MDKNVNQIKENLERVLERVEQTALKSGRKAGQVRVVVVTKGQPIEVVRLAVEAGARYLGENYPEEALGKIIALRNSTPVEWHMIGHLQSRKARIVADNFHFMHSVDRYAIAEKLNRLLGESGKQMPILLEINLSGELSKHGWRIDQLGKYDELLPDIDKVLCLPQLKVCGLMTMPPLFEDPEMARPFFNQLRVLRDFLALRYPERSWAELSMGTSSDFEVAIQEGATMVRIGQAILGSRQLK